jgi:hypothetical protein
MNIKKTIDGIVVDYGGAACLFVSSLIAIVVNLFFRKPRSRRWRRTAYSPQPHPISAKHRG